jgi:hypothetical protein
MQKDTPWNTNQRFSPDTSLLGNASMAKQLVEEHQLDNSGLQTGLQEFVDAVGTQASAAASIVSAITEGEQLKAQDRLTLNQIEQEDRQSLLKDLSINTQMSHLVRDEINKGLYLSANSLSITNRSQELRNTLALSTIELQAIQVEQQQQSITRSIIQQRINETKSLGNESIKEKLALIRQRNT